jgi:hypothetical protein
MFSNEEKSRHFTYIICTHIKLIKLTDIYPTSDYSSTKKYCLSSHFYIHSLAEKNHDLCLKAFFTAFVIGLVVEIHFLIVMCPPTAIVID